MTTVVHNKKIPYLFLAGSLIITIVFKIIPIFVSLLMSFFQWDLVSNPLFIGVKNFMALLSDSTFYVAVYNTFYYSLGTTLFSVLLGLILALFLNQSWVKGKTILRSIFFLPAICSMVAISMIWMWMFDPNYGFLNYLLSLFGLPGMRWLSDPKTAMPSLILLAIWANAGYNMVLFLAGLQGIPFHLYEAAQIDGVNRWRQLWNITLPLLKPTTFFVVTMQIIRSFQVFSQVYVMTQGGPIDKTQVLVYYLYQNGFEWFKMGYASAISMLLLLIVFLLTIVQNKLFGGAIEY
jgi:multiple sugar transport system permease protein